MKLCISLCMITKNEEDTLPGILALTKPYVDEVILVDDGSTDRTLDIAQEFGAKVISRPLNNDYAAQRNAGIEVAKGEWIFVLDGDELPSAALLEKLSELTHQDTYDAWNISRQNYTSGVLHNDKPGEDPVDPHIRLFRCHLRYAGWHSEGIREGYKNKGMVEDAPIYHLKSLERGVARHEEYRQRGMPVFPFADWFADKFHVRG